MPESSGSAAVVLESHWFRLRFEEVPSELKWNMERSVERSLLLLLLICFPEAGQGKHRLRFLTFCDRNVTGNGQYDIEYDGDQLLYADPFTYRPVQRLPEFAEEWTPDPGVYHDAYIALGTCKYNIPRAAKGEDYPPEFIVTPTSLLISKQQPEPGVPNTLICVANGLHPPYVEFTWTRNGQRVDDSEVSQTQYYSNNDFSFRTSSYLDVTPQEGDIYACSVEHVSLEAPLTRFWEVAESTGHGEVVETAVCVCGVILGLIGVVTGLWLVVKSNAPGL